MPPLHFKEVRINVGYRTLHCVALSITAVKIYLLRIYLSTRFILRSINQHISHISKTIQYFTKLVKYCQRRRRNPRNPRTLHDPIPEPHDPILEPHDPRTATAFLSLNSSGVSTEPQPSLQQTPEPGHKR